MIDACSALISILSFVQINRLGLQTDLLPFGSKDMGLNLTTLRKALSIGKDWTLSTTLASANGDAEFGTSA